MTPSVRVLHVVDSLEVGGVQVGLEQLIRLTQDRFIHSVCCVREIGPIAQRLDALAVPIHFLAKGTGHEWSLAWRIARRCRAVRPHLVHTHGWGAIDGVVGARLARVPVVIHSKHGCTNDSSPATRRQIAVYRILAPFMDRIVAVSEHLQRWLLDVARIRPGRVVLIRNGVDTDRFQRSADRDALRRAAGYQPTEFVVGTVGRLDPIKNYPGLLDAFHGLSADHPHARLLVVGDGPENAALHEAVQRRGLAHAVRLIGHRDDVREWLAMMDLFVLPSLFEGTSNAILEAMAVSLPVVATLVGGNPEVVADGVTGRLVPAHDPAALRNAIELYCRDERARAEHGAAGRARVVQYYSIQATVAGCTAVYRDALARRAVRGDNPTPCAA